MAYLKPAEILASGNFTGYTFREVTSMLAHYGFESYSRGNAAPHIVYSHREYDGIKLLSLPHPPGEVKWAYTREACLKCMEVKQHNAARRERVRMDEMPEWVSQHLPHGAQASPEGRELFVTCNGTEAPARHYRIQYWAKRVTVQSLDFPDSVVHPLRFTANDGDRNRNQSFANGFAAFDAAVASHMASREQQIENCLENLRSDAGFEITTDDAATTNLPLLHLRHSAYGHDESIVLAQPGHCSTLGTLQKLQELKAFYEERYFEQEEFKEEMAAAGWQFAEASGTNGHSTGAAFVKDAASIPVEAHGQLGLFDVSAARAALLAEQTEQPITVVSTDGAVNGQGVKAHEPARPSPGPNTLRLSAAPSTASISPTK